MIKGSESEVVHVCSGETAGSEEEQGRRYCSHSGEQHFRLDVFYQNQGIKSLMIET